MGLYIYLLKREWPLVKKIFVITGSSLLLETIQFIFALGRTDVTDLLTNTLGGVIGLGICALLFGIFKSRTVKIVKVIALTATICVVLRFGYLFYLSHFVMMR